MNGEAGQEREALGLAKYRADLPTVSIAQIEFAEDLETNTHGQGGSRRGNAVERRSAGEWVLNDLRLAFGFTCSDARWCSAC
ncbi:MAG: hypothetical protein ABI587_08965 [Gemmatimonadales bacterium]